MRVLVRMLLAAFVLTAPVLTGCVGDRSPATGSEQGDDLAPGETEVAGLGPVPALPPFLDPVVVTREAPGGEPVVDAAADGTLFYQAIGFGYEESVVRLVNTVWRSTDGGSSWEDVTPPATGQEATLDAFLHVGPDDTVYVANAPGGHLSIWRSTDLGDTWIPLPVPQPPAPIHRMWIDTAADGTIHLTAAGLLYNEQVTGLHHMRSTDGGLTWTPPTNIDQEYTLGSQLVAHEGNVTFTSLDGEETRWKLVRSLDGGTTWEDVPMWSVETQVESSWQSLAVDEDGTLYFVWAEMRDGTGRVLYRASTDHGDSWTSERKIAGPHDGSQTMPWAASPTPGTLDVVWYAAEEAGAPAQTDARWYAHMARVGDADGASPQLSVARLTPEPVHDGTLCNDGPGCDGGRELADYPWIAHGADGSIHTAFASTEKRPAPPSIDYPVADTGVPIYVGAPASS